ncbi:hypothetical protein PGT21_025127 [Puccinia graminis f. sp. tritici]|uniref:Uncharacterized protein n=1 Tax=Puccinia graminis f. sp. tritici TaxID=56615 RepID=A0A5B0PIW2_PUCGR|nr:hypothetical protein PGT21_025127 [Puccinia graminis f. sp. tritici]
MDTDSSILNFRAPDSAATHELISAFKAFTVTYGEHASCSMQAIRMIAEGVSSINESVRSGSGIHSNPTSRPSTSRRTPRRDTDEFDDIETPTNRRVHIPSTGPLPAAVRRHFITLFGQAASDGHFPPPATDEERRRWVQPVHQSSDIPVEEEFPGIDSEETNPFADEDYDPAFPYPNGPGHAQASPQSLRIMWRMMDECGVRLFRPNLAQSYNSQGNDFLWDLAARIFMRLIDAGEFRFITREICSFEMVTGMMQRYVEGHVMRIQTEAERNRVARLRRATTRRNRLVGWRLEEIRANPELAGLIKIVQTCTSEDETDAEYVDETPMDLDSELGERPARVRKRCVVLGVPWRHPRIERIFNGLDQLRQNRLAQSEGNSNAPPTRNRRRVPNPREGCRPPQFQLPRGAYHGDWMRSLLTMELNQVEATDTPLEGYIGLIRRI